MLKSEILLDALGGLLNGIVHKNPTFDSKELTFEKYASISLSAGQLEDKKQKIEKKEEKKERTKEEIQKQIEEEYLYLKKLQENVLQRIKKEKSEFNLKLEIEEKEDIILEKELQKHQNCKEKIIFYFPFRKREKEVEISCCLLEKFSLLKLKIKKKAGIPRFQQGIYFKDFNENKTPSDYEINSGNRIAVYLPLSEIAGITMQIFVKTLT